MALYTKNSLKKIEGLLSDLGFKVRYEKGNFKSGYCILENSNVVVLNKFFDWKGRIDTLLDIIPRLDIDPKLVQAHDRQFLLKMIPSLFDQMPELFDLQTEDS